MQVEITARKKWQLLDMRDFRELRHYKDLLYMLVIRDINVLYKQTVLGFAWAIIKPLLQVVIFTIVFGKLAGLDKQMNGNMPYIIFSFSALIPWTYFATALTNSTASLITNSQFLTKVYFPRLIIPLTPILSKLMDFAVSLIALFVLLFVYRVHINHNILFLPLITLLMMLTTFSLGLWLSAMAIQYRDIQQLMQFLIPILMYAAPIIWPLSILPNKPILKFIYGFYPMVGVVEGFRCSVTGGAMPWPFILSGTISTLILLVTGLLYFRAKEDYFADVA